MTTRYMKPYDIAQNKRLDILSPNEEEETYFQSFLNKYAPSLRTQYDVEKRLIAKQERNEWIGETSDAQLKLEEDEAKQKNADWERVNESLGLDEISEKISGMSYKGSSTDLDSGHEGLLSGTEDNDGIIVKSMEEELGYDKQDMQDISYSIDESADDAREDYISNQFGSPESGGMTDNAYGSDDPQMSPQMQKYALGLLKDYMAPAPDTPPQQVRGMGIVKGSGTPFPSLLQKKPERKYYTNKGLV